MGKSCHMGTAAVSCKWAWCQSHARLLIRKSGSIRIRPLSYERNTSSRQCMLHNDTNGAENFTSACHGTSGNKTEAANQTMILVATECLSQPCEVVAFLWK